MNILFNRMMSASQDVSYICNKENLNLMIPFFIDKYPTYTVFCNSIDLLNR